MPFKSIIPVPFFFGLLGQNGRSISACSSYGAHQKELEMTKKYFSLLAIFIVSGATVYANPCEDYLESFQKQHNVIGKIDAYSDKGSDIQRLIDRITIGNILAGMTMNLQLMQKHDCKNLPDYGIDVLGFRKSWQECRLANSGHTEYSKESCSNPVRSKISATY